MKCPILGAMLMLPVLLGTAQQVATPPVTRRPVLSGGRLLLKVQPVYPVAARNLGIEGNIVLHAIIGKDGHIAHLDPVSGPELLSSVAMDSVKQWIYKPFLLDGEARMVDTAITIRFRRDGETSVLAAATEPPAKSPTTPAYSLPAPEPGRARISSAVMNARVTRRVEPVYPSSGAPSTAVVLRVFIGKDGRVSEVSRVAGPELLATPAIEAVRQWEFQPYLINGELAEVETVMTLRPSQ